MRHSGKVVLNVFDEIDRGEDHDPDNINKVPVETRGFDVDCMLVRIEPRGE